jgi:transposase
MVGEPVEPLRELKYLDKRYPEQHWAKNFTALLGQALDLKRTISVEDYQKPMTERVALEKQFDELLEQTINPEHKKLITFKERMIKYRNHLLSFLYCPEVPADNNGSERAIRTYKVKQKVSGLFRAEEGTKSFAVIRSVIDTTIKNAQNVWEALALIQSVQIVNARDG